MNTRASRRRAGFLGIAIAATLVAIPLWLLLPLGGGGNDPSRPTRGGESVLQVEGISMVLPQGWHGSVDSLPGYHRRIFQVATFPLPPLTDIEATEARKAIGPGDVLIVLAEYDDTFFSNNAPESEGLPVVIGPEDFEDPTKVPRGLPPLDDVPPDHALARRSFLIPPVSDPAHVFPRYFDLRVEFGSDPVAQEALDRVNAVLASLEIGAWVPEPNGDCQWEELGLYDPDCPQPQWLREVLSIAGSTITEQRGVFEARSGGAEFFIWVEEASEVRPPPENFPIRETIQGVRVYGHSQGWEWRTNGVHVFIAEGPYGDSKLPEIKELTPIVEASVVVPYPP
jgi:hypothetical protein